MIKFDEKIVGVWYLQTTETQDWLCAIREIEPDQKYELTHRFRYYKDDKAFDSKDKKNWYRGTITGTRHYVLEVMKPLVQDLKELGAVGEPYELINNGDYDDFLRRFQDAPFVYAKQVSKEEAEKMMEEEHGSAKVG